MPRVPPVTKHFLPYRLNLDVDMYCFSTVSVLADMALSSVIFLDLRSQGSQTQGKVNLVALSELVYRYDTSVAPCDSEVTQEGTRENPRPSYTFIGPLVQHRLHSGCLRHH
jgi:hypothetical protein